MHTLRFAVAGLLVLAACTSGTNSGDSVESSGGFGGQEANAGGTGGAVNAAGAGLGGGGSAAAPGSGGVGGKEPNAMNAGGAAGGIVVQGGSGGSSGGSGGAPPLPIVDTHTHFWDSSRPNPKDRNAPIPFPGPDLKELYRPILPPEYITKTNGTGITATIVVEASGWLEDNQWLLDLAAKTPQIVGVVGSFGEVMGTNKFDQTLTRFAANTLFRGVRVGGGEVSAALSSPGRLADFTKLAAAELTVDVLGVGLADVIKLASSVPNLRIVVDHMAGVDSLNPSAGWKKDIETLAKSPVASRVYLKLSGLVESAGKTAPTDPARYKAALDHVWQQLGENQLLYSSNWPVSELYAQLPTVAQILNTFLAGKTPAAREKVFWKNSAAAYRWVPRKS